MPENTRIVTVEEDKVDETLSRLQSEGFQFFVHGYSDRESQNDKRLIEIKASKGMGAVCGREVV